MRRGVLKRIKVRKMWELRHEAFCLLALIPVFPFCVAWERGYLHTYSNGWVIKVICVKKPSEIWGKIHSVVETDFKILQWHVLMFPMPIGLRGMYMELNVSPCYRYVHIIRPHFPFSSLCNLLPVVWDVCSLCSKFHHKLHNILMVDIVCVVETFWRIILIILWRVTDSDIVIVLSLNESQRVLRWNRSLTF